MKTIGALEDCYGEWHLSVGCCWNLRTRTQGDGESLQKLEAHGRLTHHVTHTLFKSHATTEEPLKVVFSVQSGQAIQWLPAAILRCQTSKRLVWDGCKPERLWAQEQRNIHHRKKLPSHVMKNVTENTSLSVTVWSHKLLKEFNKSNSNQNPDQWTLNHMTVCFYTVFRAIGFEADCTFPQPGHNITTY